MSLTLDRQAASHRRTLLEASIRRDLELLVSMNMAEVYRKGVKLEPTLYRMRLRLPSMAKTGLEVAAIKVSETIAAMATATATLPLAEMETVL